MFNSHKPECSGELSRFPFWASASLNCIQKYMSNAHNKINPVRTGPILLPNAVAVDFTEKTYTLAQYLVLSSLHFVAYSKTRKLPFLSDTLLLSPRVWLFFRSSASMAGHEGKSHPDCINSSNPYHECSEYCYKKIAEAKAKLEEQISLTKPPAERTVHPDCINASNPYHECTDYCFKRIANTQDRVDRDSADVKKADAGPSSSHEPDVIEVPSRHERITYEEEEEEEKAKNADSGTKDLNKDAESGYPQMTEKQKKLFDLRLKMNEARKANQMAMVAEKKKMEAPTESRGISKQKWLEDRKKKIGKLLDSNGLDMKKAYMLDTQEMAETKYKKWEKEPAPHGWDVFNQKTLYNAYKKRTTNLEVDMEAYNKAKEADPEFYRDASSLQYGKVGKVPEENIDKMVKELQDREAKRKAFSRRRKFHEEKDIDSINDRNEHFNKKIERAFGKYTLEIKNNLERGTALPD